MSIAKDNSLASTSEDDQNSKDVISRLGLHTPSLEDLGELTPVVSNLVVKIASTVSNFTGEFMVDRVKLPLQIVEDVLWKLKEEKLVEILGKASHFSYRYTITSQGLELAKRLMEICGYVGPAPVRLEDYTRVVETQANQYRPVNLEQVRESLNSLVLPPGTHEIVALAAASRRSLFVFGPAGNGKSTLCRALHDVVEGDCWIPYSIAVEEQVIRIFDPQVHESLDYTSETAGGHDQRWRRIKRPLVVAGGEMNLEQLDLVPQSAKGLFEAPLHMKANGGSFIIDDFGRQRVDPHDLLNRWIIPLEKNVDFLTMNNGQKIEVPFRSMLVISTNLKTSDIADPAFLRRMGYRIHLDAPNETEFRDVIALAASFCGFDVPEAICETIVSRYKSESRPWRASEPRDLLLRCQDICKLRGIERAVTEEILDIAWRGYFGGSVELMSE